MFLFGLTAEEKRVHRFQVCVFIFYYSKHTDESNAMVTLRQYWGEFDNDVK